MYQYSPIICNQRPTLMLDVNSRGNWGNGIYENSVLSAQFFYKSKIALKYKGY